MNSAQATLPILLALLLTPACSITVTSSAGSKGAWVGFQAIVGDCAAHDVVFFGELHDNDRCHEQQLGLLKSLFAERSDVIVSMEMFERDVQAEVDAFLAGNLAEEEFRKRARAWKNWHHYRGIVQFAKKNALQVIAANAPLALVRKVSTGGGLAAVRGEPDVAREVLAPRDVYYDRFVAAMSGHGVLDEEKLGLYYEAQCLRDDTMAESIAMALSAARASGRNPLVLHLCGRMHSDERLGTVQRLQRRMPGLAVRVISTSTVAWYRTGSGDFQLLAPHMIKMRPAPQTKPATTAKADPAHPTKPAKVDPNARPGLGFKPLYDIGDQYGVGVDYPIPGGAADKAGIKNGDIITSLNGEELQDIEHYTEVLAEQKIGKKVKVVILRDKKKISLEVVIGVSGR
ncbi:MAG: ChaN family lipoprotein [Planctomycetota bacterium]|nr:ChaN family lipoprotein [Planctomycetota bacterium]